METERIDYIVSNDIDENSEITRIIYIDDGNDTINTELPLIFISAEKN